MTKPSLIQVVVPLVVTLIGCGSESGSPTAPSALNDSIQKVDTPGGVRAAGRELANLE